MKKSNLIAVIFVTIFTVALMILTISGYESEKKLEAVLAKAQEEGVAFKVEDLRSTRPEGTKFFDGPAEASAVAFLLSPQAAWRGSGVYVEDWSWFQTNFKAYRVFHLTSDEEEEVRTVIQENETLISEMKRVSQLPPTSLVDVARLSGLDSQVVDNMYAPNLHACRAFANLLVLDSYVAWRNKRTSDSLETLVNILDLSEHIRDIPDSLSQVIGMGASGVAIQYLAEWLTLEEPAIPRDAERAFLSRIPSLKRREGIAQAFNLEMIAGLQAVSMDFGTQHFGMDMRIYSSLPGKIMQLKDKYMITIVSLTGKQMRLSKQPYFELIADSRQLWDEFMNTAPWKRGFVSTRTVPYFSRDGRYQAEHETRLNQARIALALNRYKQDSGEYPEELAKLVPQYLEEIPLDMFTGKEMLYYRDGESYVLYSVGVNEKSDLSKTKSDTNKRKFVTGKGATFYLPPSQGRIDIVWGAREVLRKREQK
ncbi:hypothetical protein ACFL1X_12980 [Candidatus Hydrogenedentota bacterium]